LSYIITETCHFQPVVLAAHFVGEQLQFGSDLVFITSLNERYFATAAKQEPHHLTETTVTVAV